MNVTNMRIKVGAIGGLIGGTIGYFLGRWIYETYFEEIDWESNPQISSYNEDEWQDLDQKVIDEIDRKIRLNNDKNTKNNPYDYTKHYVRDDKKPELADLVSKINSIEVNKDELERANKLFEDLKQEVMITPPQPEKGIELITSNEFLDTSNGFVKTSLYMYWDDKVVVDEMEEVVTDAVDLFGRNYVEIFEENYALDATEVIYIRNNNNRSDYEIVIISGAYAPLPPKPNRHRSTKKTTPEPDEDEEDNDP